MTKAILCFCCPGTGQQKRQSSNYSPVATYGSRKNAAGAYAAAAWVKKRLLFVGIIFIYFQVGLNSNRENLKSHHERTRITAWRSIIKAAAAR
jgi:hypothetical protein